jgi:single-strand DNA-binding protein
MCNQYLSKGRTVYIEGRIQTREWEDKDGAKRYTTEINASTVNFIGPRQDGAGGGGGGAGGGGGNYGGGGGAPSDGGGAPSGGGGMDSSPPMDDDIPF